ncbi:MAG: hypothetical protein KJ011_05240 [Burkholderiaceae bacterium]|nr:hypothetical protein [Burkholderiaceae bacterium]
MKKPPLRRLPALYPGRQARALDVRAQEEYQRRRGSGQAGHARSRRIYRDDIYGAADPLLLGLIGAGGTIEVAQLAEEVLSPGAVARIGDHGMVNLWGPRRMEFVPGQRFQPMGILNDPMGADLPHLFGVIPKGWPGRK